MSSAEDTSTDLIAGPSKSCLTPKDARRVTFSDEEPTTVTVETHPEGSEMTTGFHYWNQLEADDEYWEKRSETYRYLAPEDCNSKKKNRFGEEWVGSEKELQEKVFILLGTTALNAKIAKGLRKVLGGQVEDECASTSVFKDTKAANRQKIEELQQKVQETEDALQTAMTALKNELEAHSGTKIALTNSSRAINAIAGTINGLGRGQHPSLASSNGPPSRAPVTQGNTATLTATGTNDKRPSQPPGMPQGQ